MTIRKTGAVTGQVTEVEQVPEEGIAVTASRGPDPQWAQYDEVALIAENTAADQE